MLAPKDMVKPPRIALRPTPPSYRPCGCKKRGYSGDDLIQRFVQALLLILARWHKWQQNGGNFQTNIIITSSNIHKLLAFLSSPLIHCVGNIQQASWDWIMKTILGMANGLKQNSPTCQWWPDRPIILIHNHRLGTPVPQRMWHLHKPTDGAT